MGVQTARTAQREQGTFSLVGARVGLYTRASDDHEITTTSVTAQDRRGTRWADMHECVIPEYGRYTDNDKSASWYGTKPRTEFQRLIQDMKAGKLDVVWVYAISRIARDNGEGGSFAFRDLCRMTGVILVVKNKIYDLNDPSDLRQYGNDAVAAEADSVEKSAWVREGTMEAALRGKPHGAITYGYMRIYDERTRKFIRQIPDRTVRETTDKNGNLYRYSTASVVKDIITLVSKSRPIAQICAMLESRGIPAPKGGPIWARSVVTSIARNPAYIGIRVHKPRVGEIRQTPNAWPSVLVDGDDIESQDMDKAREIFYAAQNVLKSPSRKTTKPGKGKNLLSFLGTVRCECGRPLATESDTRKSGIKVRYYKCYEKRCTSIQADMLDDFVRKMVDAYLARDDVRQSISAKLSDDAELVAARAEVNAINAEIRENMEARKAGRLDLSEYLEFKEALSERLRAAEARAEVAGTPPVLRAAQVEWDNIPVARQTVAEILSVTLHKIGKGRKNVPVDERITWEWLLGPDAG